MDKLDSYFENLKRGVDECYGVAGEARKRGLDPVDSVECPLALTMAERSVNLVKTIYPSLNVDRVSKRILELEEKYGQLSSVVVFRIAREIAGGEFGKFGGVLENIDCGLRVGFAYMTLGVVVSPIEGYTGIKVGIRNKENKNIPQKVIGSSTHTTSCGSLIDLKDKIIRKNYYLSVNFSGPIRSAGTTATCVFLMLVDFLREEFGFGKYNASKEEVERYVVENKDYHERVTNLAYFPTEDEMRFLASRLPVQIGGDPTERLEVSGFKDLKRVETNRIRGGMCLAFSEGLALKAEKGWGRVKSVKEDGLNFSGWDWIPDYVKLHRKRFSGAKDIEASYIKDIVAGRPVFGHPGRSGVFRFRYGRSRTSGFSGASIHPAAMGVTGGFLSHGTQLRLEKPTKACVVTGCDSIEGPVVKLKSGSVRRLDNYDEALKLYKSSEIEEVIYLGDILFPVGDLIDRNVDLIKPGYIEEWWEAEKGERIKNKEKGSIGNCDTSGVAFPMEEYSKKFNFEDIISFCRENNLSLHPSLIFYWSQISHEEFFGLVKWLNGAVWRKDKLVLNWEASRREEFSLGKRALEILGVSHEVVLDNVVLDERNGWALLFNFGKEEVYNGEVLNFKVSEVDERGVLDIVNGLCSLEIRDKWGTGIGSRMGRPEKAKLRKLVGSPNVLFPVGTSGGRLKSINEALKKGFVKSEFGCFRCECGRENILERCVCGKKGVQVGFCRKCGEVKEKDCKFHGELEKSWSRKVELKDYFDEAVGRVGEVEEVKGVVKLNNDSKVPENLAKGFLRARYNLSVNKDGTVRYDATEIPLTHFKPKEIGVSIEKLKVLGYLRDYLGKDLVSENQILELMPHDVVLPDASVLGKERCGEVFLNIANFVDEELERFYDLERFYNFKKREDFVGQLVVCMAPHNCAGVIGRIIGFSKMQGLLASPFMHAAMRRDCDGDECSVMMLMDVLLNFSKEFLPSHRGGSQDAPLVLNARIREGEVDDQILFFDSVGKYPLEFYEMANEEKHSSEVRGVVELIGDKLKKGESGFLGNGFGFDCEDFNLGNNNNVYKSLPSMKEKVSAQMELVGKLRGVDEDDVARLILERHFIRDIRGNLRKFCRQQFRCSGCNEKYRRPPLVGNCAKCGGKLIFSVSEGSVRKYVEPALELVRDYNISEYTKENMELIGDFIERIFGKGEEQQLL